MDGLPSMETVYQAISTLYHHPDCNKKNEANQWLINLQKSVFAWQVADQLLQRQTDVESCYFGAQMIRNKIMFSFHELKPDDIESLRSSLMQHLTKIISDDTNRIIITQLCIAVVDLSLQMSNWKNPIYSFLNKYNEIPPIVLLEILRVFPEEIDTELLRLGSNRRNEIFDELCNCFELLNDYLKQVILEEPTSDVILKAFKCFASWISVGFTNMSNILKCELLPKSFEILANPSKASHKETINIESKLHHTATEVICCFLRCLRGPEAYSVLDTNLMTKVACFEDAYQASISHECSEKAQNYCRIFSELAEAYLPLMIDETLPQNPHYSLKILNLLLICMEHRDFEVCLITFNFWSILSERIYLLNDDDLTEEFKPYISKLLASLCHQVQMDSDYEGLLEENDEFKLFRDKVSDLIKDVVFIVGSTHTFCQIFLSLQNSCSLTWDQLEANLFVMHAVAKNILPEKNDVIPDAVENILILPETTHIAVKYTALLILGELCDWFDKHPDYLDLTLKFLASCLQQSDLANAAAASICSICHSAKIKLNNSFAPLLDILRNLHSFNLTNESAIAITKGIVKVMSCLLPEDFAIAVKEVCWLQANPLRQITKDRNRCILNNVNVDFTTNSNAILYIDRLAAVFKFIEPVSDSIINATAIALSEIQSVIFEVIDEFHKDVKIMERCCRCLRFAIRCTGKVSVFILEPLIEKLVIMYGNSRHSCFMYLASILVDEYGENASYWELLIRMVDAFVEPTLGLLQNTTGFREHPDTVDDLFRLCTRVLQRLPIVFLRSSTIWPVLECSLVAISLEHREANESVMKFFHEIFDFPNSKDRISTMSKRDAVQEIFKKCGELLIHNLLHASVFVLPVSVLSNVSEAIYDLIHFNLEESIKWMTLAIHKLPKETSAGGLIASDDQIQVFLNACENASNVKEFSRALKQFTFYYR